MADFRDVYKEPLFSAKKMLDNKMDSFNAVITDIVEDEKENEKGEKVPCLTITLDGGEYRIRLNKTNAVNLMRAFGRDWEKWVSQVINVGLGKTLFMGKRVDCLDISVPKVVKKPK